MSQNHTNPQHPRREKPQNAGSSFADWIEKLKKKNSVSSALDFFIKTSDFPISYFEYQSEKGWLSLKYSNCFSLKDPLCLRLFESDSNFEPSKLYNPKQIPVFHSHLKEWFEEKEYQCFPFVFNKKVIGIFVYLSGSCIEKEHFFVLNSHIKNFLWEEKWEMENLRDELTNGLNKKAFLQRLFVEVARARRLSLPLSLTILRLDQFETLKSVYGSYKPELFIKSLMNNFVKDSRLYDIFGYWPEGYLGLMLPHTSERGASLKVEKMRWSVQSADFLKVFPSHGRLTLSAGLAEYPRVNRSAESLFRSTLKALAFAEGEGGGNITAVATPPVGFKPDFPAQNIVNPLRDLT